MDHKAVLCLLKPSGKVLDYYASEIHEGALSEKTFLGHSHCSVTETTLKWSGKIHWVRSIVEILENTTITILGSYTKSHKYTHFGG